MMSKPVCFRLYIAGHGPNSCLAETNLAALCEKHLAGHHHIEVVDVLEHPERALEDGVFLTPQLIILSMTPPQTIIGNLSQPKVLLRILGLPGGEP